MFLYEVTRPVSVAPGVFDEGRLEWHNPADLQRLDIPDTDRLIIWPLFWKFRRAFFTVHITCHDGDLRWQIQHPPDLAAPDPSRGPVGPLVPVA